MPRLKTTLPAIALVLLSAAVQAADLLDVKVEKEEARYYLYSETEFGVGQEALYELLTDYEQFEKFTSAIVDAKNLDLDDKGRPGFYARMQGCALLFCKSFVRHGFLVLSPLDEIVAVAIPGKSGFHYSRERWQLIPTDEGTRLIYDFEMEPAFWIPPVIGPFFIQRALKNGAIRAVDRIERLALEIENEKLALKPVD